MSDISSYLGIGIALIVLGLGWFVINKPVLLKLSARKILKDKKVAIISFLLIFFISALISSSIFVSDSYGTYTDNLISQKIGKTDGIIYLRNPKAYWNETEASKVYSNVLSEFDGFLPIFYSIDTLNGSDSLDTVVVSFNPNSASSYSSSLVKESDYKDLKPDEVILSESYAKDKNLKVGDEIGLNTLLDQKLTVVKVLQDNGILGFNFPVSSRFQNFKGSIYVSQEALENLNLQNGSIYNALLLRTSIDYDTSSFTQYVNNKLVKYDRDLIFEELANSYSSRLSGGSGLSLSQIILLLSTIPLICLVIFYYFVYANNIDKESKLLSKLNATGLSKNGFILLSFLEGAIYSFLGAFFGTFAGYFLAQFYFGFLGFILGTNNLFDKFFIVASPSSYFISFGMSFMILLLINLLICIRLSSDQKVFDIGKNQINESDNVFKLKDHTLLFGLMIACLGLFYYVFNYVKEVDVKSVIYYFNIQIVLWMFSYLAIGLNPKRKTVYLNIVCLTTLVINIVAYRYFGLLQIWQSNPYFYLINAAIILVFSTILLVTNLTLLKAILTKLRINSATLNLAFGILRESKFSIFIIIFCSVVIFSTISLPIASNVVNQIRNNLGNKYDLIIVDQKGLSSEADIKEKISRLNVESIKVINYTTADLPDFTYESIGAGEEAAALNKNLDDRISESISTLDEGTLNEINIQADPNIPEPNKEFLTSSSYVILGNNYKKAFAKDNVRADIRVGDKVKISFQGVNIERKVLAIIDNESASQTSVNSDENTKSFFSRNGIFISEKDYNSLRTNRKVYFNRLYGLIYKDGDKESTESHVIETLKNDQIAAIYNPASLFKNNLELIEKSLNILTYYVYASLVLIFICFATVILNYIVENKYKIQNNLNSGLLSNTLTFAYIIAFFIMMTSSFILGAVLNYASGRAFFVHTIGLLDDKILYTFPYNFTYYLGAIILGITIGVSIFIFIRMKIILRRDG